MTAHHIKLSLTQSADPTLRKIKCQAKRSQALQVSQSRHCPVRDMARCCGGTSQKSFLILMCSCGPAYPKYSFATDDTFPHLPMMPPAVPITSTWTLPFPQLPELLQQGMAVVEERARGEESGLAEAFCSAEKQETTALQGRLLPGCGWEGEQSAPEEPLQKNHIKLMKRVRNLLWSGQDEFLQKGSNSKHFYLCIYLFIWGEGGG